MTKLQELITVKIREAAHQRGLEFNIDVEADGAPRLTVKSYNREIYAAACDFLDYKAFRQALMEIETNSCPYHFEVASFLNALVEQDFLLKGVNDGEGFIEPEGKHLKRLVVMRLTRAICAVDESTLVVIKQGFPQERREIIFVLGNGPGEAVADYTADERLDVLTTAHYFKFNGSL